MGLGPLRLDVVGVREARAVQPPDPVAPRAGVLPGHPFVAAPVVPGPAGHHLLRIALDLGEELGGAAASPWSEEPDTESERYLLQIWPAPPSAAESIAATTPWCQYWAFGPAAEALVAELSDVPDPDRLGVVIDRALSDHPDVARRLREGQHVFQSGIVRYAQELFRVTYASDAYADLRQDSSALRRLITARAESIA